MHTLLQDLRYGLRTAVRQPGYSLLVVLTLALAIGANTVTFSFTNILLVRPLPVRDQSSLVWIFMVNGQQGINRGFVSVPDLLDLRASLRSIENLAGSTPGAATMTGRGEARPLTTSRVTANLLDMWGAEMAAGRRFAQGEDAPGAPAVAILSHRFWQRQFNGDAAIVGQSLTLNGVPHTVVGIVSPVMEIGNLSTIDLWTPFTIDPSLPRDSRVLRVSARLAPGVTFAQADAELRATAERLRNDHPDTNAAWLARLAPTREAIAGGDTWSVLALLSLVVGAVLLLACANIANMVLARATVRRREFAVRSALGASRGRMIRQLLTESILLGLCGGALGLVVAQIGLVAIKAAAYEPIFELISIDRYVLLFTATLSLLTPIVFSMLPALHASRADVNEALKDSNARAGGGVKGRRSRAILVVSQLAIAVSLLIVSTLFVRSMFAITRTAYGIVQAGTVTMRIEAPEWKYRNDAAVKEYFDRLLARLASLPGVVSVATVDRLPLIGSEPTIGLTVDGFTPPTANDRPWAVRLVASDRYFDTAGIPLLAGRGPRPDEVGEPVAVINQEMARRYWSSADRAIGARIQIDGDSRGWIHVIGICGNIKRADLTGVNPQVFLPASQVPSRAMAMLLRTADSQSLMAAARETVRAVDSDVAIHQLRTFDAALDDELSSSRIVTGMLASFAVLALMLAASGLYGVMAYAVSQRTQEIGIRMALGALTTDISRLVVRQTLVLVLLGCGLGLLAGALMARAAAGLLYDVSPGDPASYGVVVLVLCAVAVAAVYAPIRRATHVDPLRALRSE
jgi:putative ABC transport system permease protein